MRDTIPCVLARDVKTPKLRRNYRAKYGIVTEYRCIAMRNNTHFSWVNDVTKPKNLCNLGVTTTAKAPTDIVTFSTDFTANLCNFVYLFLHIEVVYVWLYSNRLLLHAQQWQLVPTNQQQITYEIRTTSIDLICVKMGMLKCITLNNSDLAIFILA